MMLQKETGKTLAQFALNMFDFDAEIFGDMRGTEHEKAQAKQIENQNNQTNEDEEEDEEEDDDIPF